MFSQVHILGIFMRLSHSLVVIFDSYSNKTHSWITSKDISKMVSTWDSFLVWDKQAVIELEMGDIKCWLAKCFACLLSARRLAGEKTDIFLWHSNKAKYLLTRLVCSGRWETLCCQTVDQNPPEPLSALDGWWWNAELGGIFLFLSFSYWVPVFVAVCIHE